MDFAQVVQSLKTPPITGWSKKLIWRGTASGAVGMLLGMIISLVVNVALVEISVSPFFAVYFGALFVVTGGVIAWRVSSVPITDDEHKGRQRVFLYLSLLVSASGVLCCFIQKHWFFVLPRILKVPVYSLLGVSLAFVLIFSTIDLMNVAFGLCQLNYARSPVDSAVQVSLIVGAALHVRLSLLREEQFCYPIGGVIGAMVSVIVCY